MKFNPTIMPAIRRMAIELPAMPKVMLNNQVLVKILDDFISPHVQLKSGLWQDITWEDTENAMFRGQVVKVPEKLKYYEKDGVPNLENDGGVVSISDYDTTMELQVGDIIYYGYHHFKRVALKNGLLFYNEDGEMFFPVKYDKIYCAIRNEQFVPVNGYVLVEDIPTQTSLIINHLEVFTKNRIDHIALGKVIAAGSPLKQYMMKFKTEFFYRDHGFVQPGDEIFYHTSGPITAKYFEGPGCDYRATHERYIIAKLKNGKVIPNNHVLYVKPIHKPASRIIHSVKLQDTTKHAEAEVIAAPKRLKFLVGKKILHEKSNILTFERNFKRYDFVYNIENYTIFAGIDEQTNIYDKETIVVHD